MTADQRKAHKYIWLAIALLIPVILFFTVSGLTFPTTQNHVHLEQVILEKEGNEIRLLLNEPFRSSSAVVYGLTAEGKRGESLGQLNGAGNYTFKTIQSVKGILVMDEIKGLEIYKSEF